MFHSMLSFPFRSNHVQVTKPTHHSNRSPKAIGDQPSHVPLIGNPQAISPSGGNLDPLTNEFLNDFLSMKLPPSGIRNGLNLCYSTAAINSLLSVKSFRAQIFGPHRCREHNCVTCSLQLVVKKMMR